MKSACRNVWVQVTLLIAGLCFLAGGCGQPAPPATVDAPRLADALRWVGSCAVACSAITAAAIIIASRKRK